MTSTQTLITFVLDETGSMRSIKDDTIGGFNEFLSRIRKEDAATLFTLIKFDSQRTAVVHRALPVAQVPELTDETYQPGAMTPLVDACMKGIEVAERNAAQDTQVSIVIQTDGLENASRKFRKSDLLAKVTEKTNLGWMFTFLGAGIDAFAQAADFGIGRDHTLRYGRDKSPEAFRATADKNRRFMAESASASYLDSDREAARDEGEEPPKAAINPRRTRQSSLLETEK